MKPMKKRLLSLLLTLVTILSLLPTAAFAASNTGSGLKITTNQAYWSTRLLANGTPYSYRPPLVDGKLVYCMDSGLGYGNDFWEAYRDGYAAGWFTRYEIIESPLFMDKEGD